MGFQTNPGTLARLGPLNPRRFIHLDWKGRSRILGTVLQVPRRCVHSILCTRRPGFLPAV